MPEYRSNNRFAELLEPFTRLFTGLEGPASELLAFFKVLEQDKELAHRRKIYRTIAKFVKEKLEGELDSFTACLSATYFLCGETDQDILIETVPSKQTEKIILTAKKNIIAIKVHYTEVDDPTFVTQKIEIFALGNSENIASVKRIEEYIRRDSIPPEIKGSIPIEAAKSVSFQIYP